MIKSIMDDNKNIKLSSFYKRCPKKYYKGVVVVDSKNPTYHFLRQDNNLFWSHKPGTTPVTNKDASGRLIAVPHLSDMNYSKNQELLIMIKHVPTCVFLKMTMYQHTLFRLQLPFYIQPSLKFLLIFSSVFLQNYNYNHDFQVHYILCIKPFYHIHKCVLQYL